MILKFTWKNKQARIARKMKGDRGKLVLQDIKTFYKTNNVYWSMNRKTNGTEQKVQRCTPIHQEVWKTIKVYGILILMGKDN